MKKLLFLILFLIPLFTFSQLFEGGIIIGFSGNQIDGDTQGGYKKLGANSGIFLEMVSQKKTTLLIELFYIGKGAVKNTKLEDGYSFQEFKSNLHYIEMPVLVLHKLNNYFKLAGGIAPSYLLKSKLYNLDSEIPEYFYDMRDFNYSLLLQTQYNINKKTSLNLAFSYSILSIRKDDYWINNSLIFSLRYKIST